MAGATLAQLRCNRKLLWGKKKMAWSRCGRWHAFNAKWQLLLSCLPLGKNVWTTSEKLGQKKTLPQTAARIQINRGRRVSERLAEEQHRKRYRCRTDTGTCSASFGWQFACTRQPSTANSCLLGTCTSIFCCFFAQLPLCTHPPTPLHTPPHAQPLSVGSTGFERVLRCNPLQKRVCAIN